MYLQYLTLKCHSTKCLGLRKEAEGVASYVYTPPDVSCKSGQPDSLTRSGTSQLAARLVAAGTIAADRMSGLTRSLPALSKALSALVTKKRADCT